MDWIYQQLKHIAYQDPFIIYLYTLGFIFIFVQTMNCVPRAYRNHKRRAARRNKFLHK